MQKLGVWFNRNKPADPDEIASTASSQGGGSTASVEEVVSALKRVYDPEIPVNIYDLGLIYRCDIDQEGQVEVDMTLTAPGCPVAQEFPGMVESEILKVEGVHGAHVEIVWDPPWSMDRMSEEAKLELGML